MTTTITGDCFVVAARRLRLYPSSGRLVHGRVMGHGPLAGQRHWHAWVEFDSEAALPMPDGSVRVTTLRSVDDHSNGHEVITSVAWYRKIADAEDIREYDANQANDLMHLTGTYGPWEQS